MKKEYGFSVIYLIMSYFILFEKIDIENIQTSDIILFVLMLISSIIILVTSFRELRKTEFANLFMRVLNYFIVFTSLLFIISGLLFFLRWLV